MRTSRVLIPLLLLFGSLGCGVCLYEPLHSDDTVYFAPELLGRWNGENPDATWVFERGEGRSYLLRSNLTDAVRTVHFIRLGETLFMTSTNFPPSEEPVLSTCQCILSGKIELHDASFTLHALNVQALADLLQAAEDAPQHKLSEGEEVKFILFSGESRPVRRFLAAHADSPNLFDEDSVRTFARAADESAD